MSLAIYKTEGTDYPVGTDQASSFVIGKNRRGNFTLTHKLYIASTSANTWHSNILIQTTTTSAINILDGSQGYGIKVYSGVLEPSNRTWDNIAYGNNVRINNIGTSGTADNTYRPLWVYTDVPSNTELGIYPFDILITSIEHPI